MKNKLKIAAFAGALALIATSAAQAATVVYSTVGLFGAATIAGGGTTSVTSGTATLSFNSLLATAVDAPTNISYGEFISAGGTGTFGTTANPLKFFLTVFQTTPTNTVTPSQTFGVGTFSGTITSTSNGIVVSFLSGNTLAFGNDDDSTTTYRVLLESILVPPSSNAGVTSLQGTLQYLEPTNQTNTVPLPASVWGGLGTLAVLGGLQLRRKLAK